MAYSPRQMRAIANHAKKWDLRPQLSANPVVTFLTRGSEIVTENITTLCNWYDADRKRAANEQAKENQRKKKVKKTA